MNPYLHSTQQLRGGLTVAVDVGKKPAADETLAERHRVAVVCAVLPRVIPEEGVDFDAEMERIELAYLTAALRRTQGRKTAAAALLRIDPQRMKYLCRKYGI